jgi:hypothetical protein
VFSFRDYEIAVNVKARNNQQILDLLPQIIPFALLVCPFVLGPLLVQERATPGLLQTFGGRPLTRLKDFDVWEATS